MSRAMSPRWFVSRLTSYADAPRTVMQGDDFHNRCIAVFETPELAAAAVAEHNAALDEAAAQPETVAAPASSALAPNASRSALAIAAQLHARAVELCDGTEVSVDTVFTLATIAARIDDAGFWSAINPLLVGRQN